MHARLVRIVGSFPSVVHRSLLLAAFASLSVAVAGPASRLAFFSGTDASERRLAGSAGDVMPAAEPSSDGTDSGRASPVRLDERPDDAEREPITDPYAAPPNDLCTAAQTLFLDTPVTGSNVGAANQYIAPANAACFGGLGQSPDAARGSDVAYSFVATDSGRYSFRVGEYTGPNAVLYLSSSCPGTPYPATIDCLAAANRNEFRSELISCVSLTAGQLVYVFVDEKNIGTSGTFTLEVTRCASEREPNASPEAATPAACGIEGSISTGFFDPDFDTYRIGAPPAGSRLFVLVDGHSSNLFDFDLFVTTSDSTLEFDDNNADVPYGISSPATAGTPLPGEADVFVTVNQRSANVSEPYRIHWAVQPPIAAATTESEPNGTLATAGTSPIDYFRGALSSSSDTDLFAFTAAAGDLLFLGLDGDPLRDATPMNAALALLDSSGAVLVSVNDAASTSSTASGAGSTRSTTPFSPGEAIVRRVVVSGTYYARVTGAGAGDYLLSVARGCSAAAPADLVLTKTAEPDPAVSGGSSRTSSQSRTPERTMRRSSSCTTRFPSTRPSARCSRRPGGPARPRRSEEPER